MALTFQQLRLRIRARCAGQVDDATIEAITRDKLRELWESWSWSFRMARAVLATIAPKSAGTITLNVDPTKVDGTGTAFAAEDVGAELLVSGSDTPSYPISAVNVGTQQLTLGSPYVGASFTVSTYVLEHRVYALASDFGTSLRLPSGSSSWRFTYRGVNSAGVPQAEISPVPSTAMGIEYSFKRALPTLVDTTVVVFAETPLVYLCASDALSIKAVELAQANPAAAQVMQAAADKYQALGQNALEEFRDQDFPLTGASQAVKDADAGGMYSDDYHVSHDVFSPIG